MKKNFRPYILLHEGSNITLITNIISDPPLSSGYPIWFHQGGLPLNANVTNYMTKEVSYSVLSLYDLSFYNDGGNYTNTASNECGASLVFVFVDITKSKS